MNGGSGHAERAASHARTHGFPVIETTHEGHAVKLAKLAVADRVDLLAVCGGDGTVHEVVRGLASADALEAVTLCVVPAGTVNLVAEGLCVRSLKHGFKVADGGETRRLDLGIANDEPFITSAMAGLPTEASVDTSSDLKSRFGAFEFVIEGIWEGKALSVMIGNLRRFIEPNERANAENGTLEVTIVESMAVTSAVVESVKRRLLHQETEHVIDLETSCLEIVSKENMPVTFSRDGEIRDYERVRISVRPRILRVRVEDEYISNSE